jgi:hypothetical protein
MQTVVGIFPSARDARSAVGRLRAAGIGDHHIGMLVPGSAKAEIEGAIPTDEGEAPGMGAAVGGVIGGAVGLSTAAVMLPGVGPLIAAGLLAAGVVGAAGGAVVGDKFEDRLSGGLPRDELPRYEAALRQGRSLAVANVESDDEVDRVRDIFSAAGAENGAQ